jgi:hypothetical protein
MFSNIGAFSNVGNFVYGNAKGAIKWIEGEIEAFDEVLIVRGDFYACVGALGVVSLLQMVGCEHTKIVIQPDFVISPNDITEPSAKAIALAGRFYSKV